MPSIACCFLLKPINVYRMPVNKGEATEHLSDVYACKESMESAFNGGWVKPRYVRMHHGRSPTPMDGGGFL